MANTYWLLRGCATVGKFNSSGVKIGGVEVHNVDLEITVQHTYAEHKNTCNEVSRVDARDVVETMVKAKISIDQIKSDVLAMALGGIVTDTATGATFTNKSFPSGLVVGDIVPVPDGRMNLESLVITDSTGSPVTLTAGTHYTADLRAGLITILSLTSITQPLKAAGEEVDDFYSVSIANESKQERWLRFDGINLNDNNNPVLLDLHKLSFDPVTVPVKQSGNDYSVFGFEPTLIADEDAPLYSTFGPYGRLLAANA